MRTESVDSMKKHNKPRRNIPREGSKIRKMYDLFMTNKGVILELTMRTKDPNNTRITQLIDFYGLDIRCLSNSKGSKIKTSKWVLAGEWFGKVYVDYVVERLKEQGSTKEG